MILKDILGSFPQLALPAPLRTGVRPGNGWLAERSHRPLPARRGRGQVSEALGSQSGLLILKDILGSFLQIGVSARRFKAKPKVVSDWPGPRPLPGSEREGQDARIFTRHIGRLHSLPPAVKPRTARPRTQVHNASSVPIIRLTARGVPTCFARSRGGTCWPTCSRQAASNLAKIVGTALSVKRRAAAAHPPHGSAHPEKGKAS